MALQILNQPSWQSLTGQGLGQGVGQGISDLLQQLSQKPEIEKQRGASAQLFQQLGLSPQMAQNAALQPLDIQKSLLQNQQNQQKLAQQQKQAESFAQALSSMEGGPQAQQGFNLPVGAGLSEKQATSLAKLSGAQKDRAAREQERIIKHNQPYNKILNENIGSAKPVNETARRLLNNLNSGKVQAGPVWGRAKGILANDESQLYDKDIIELVLRKAAAAKGRPTDFKTKLEQSSKIDRFDKEGAQRKKLQDIINETDEIILQDHFRKKIIDENGGFEPRNLQNLVIKAVHEYQKTGFVDKLPDPTTADKDEQYEDVDSGVIFQSNGTEWVPVKGAQNAV